MTPWATVAGKIPFSSSISAYLIAVCDRLAVRLRRPRSSWSARKRLSPIGRAQLFWAEMTRLRMEEATSANLIDPLVVTWYLGLY